MAELHLNPILGELRHLPLWARAVMLSPLIPLGIWIGWRGLLSADFRNTSPWHTIQGVARMLLGCGLATWAIFGIVTGAVMTDLTWFQVWALGIIHIGVACFGAMVVIWLADRSLRKHSDNEEEKNRTSHPNWWQ